MLSDDLDENTVTDLVSGAVGEGLAVKFMAHRKVASELPNPSEILEGKITEMKSKEISAMYSLTVSLCYELKEANDKKDNDKWLFHSESKLLQTCETMIKRATGKQPDAEHRRPPRRSFPKYLFKLLSAPSTPRAKALPRPQVP